MNVLVENSSLQDIADSIRAKLGVQTTYKPGEMADAIDSISGGITPTGTVSITQNGTTDVTQYASASVNVPNSYSASDEGKVVSDGALVSQSSDTVTANDTYDTTLINSLTVNVSGGGMPARLIDYAEVTLTTKATGSNKVSVNLTPMTDGLVVVCIDDLPSQPDSTDYIALVWARLFVSYGNYSTTNTALGTILRPAGTIGSDATICSFDRSTGVLQLGGSYGYFLAGTTYRIYEFEIGAA